MSNEDFDFFKTFIFLMYIALNKKTIANYKEKLKRGQKLRKEKYNKL